MRSTIANSSGNQPKAKRSARRAFLRESAAPLDITMFGKMLTVTKGMSRPPARGAKRHCQFPAAPAFPTFGKLAFNLLTATAAAPGLFDRFQGSQGFFQNRSRLSQF